MISHENLESLRQATIEDVGGIIKLIEPLEADGTLVKRGRELIEREIEMFSVIEHDGVIFGCAALYPFPEQKMAEMACLTVNPEVQARATATASSSTWKTARAPWACKSCSC
jgi:amino-acid N-acetyltransferase